MHAAEVPEKIIQERTGHHSIKGSDKQHQAVSNILSSTSTYQAQIVKLDCSSQNLAQWYRITASRFHAVLLTNLQKPS